MLNKYLKKDRILLEFQARNFSDALRKMLEKSSAPASHNIIEQILKREKLMSFIMRKNFALPRVVLEDKKQTEVIIAINKRGVKLSPDKNPVKLIMLFLFPAKSVSAVIIAQTLRILNDDNLRDELIESKDPGQVIALIKDWESE